MSPTPPDATGSLSSSVASGEQTGPAASGEVTPSMPPDNRSRSTSEDGGQTNRGADNMVHAAPTHPQHTNAHTDANAKTTRSRRYKPGVQDNAK